jgi:hypothetical protein
LFKDFAVNSFVNASLVLVKPDLERKAAIEAINRVGGIGVLSAF